MKSVTISPDYVFENGRQKVKGCTITYIPNSDQTCEQLELEILDDVVELRDALTAFINSGYAQQKDNDHFLCEMKKMNGKTYLIDHKNRKYQLIHEKGEQQ